MKLFFDTETTGLVNFKLDITDSRQPRLVQLAALLTDNDGTEAASINLTIKPVGFDIPTAASDVHGITTERATEIGVNAADALSCFCGLWNVSDLVVAHNIKFDLIVVLRELHLYKLQTTKTVPSFCTMDAMTDLCKLPGKFGNFKWPRLQEAYIHCFGEAFPDAHDALADVRACAAVYFWLQKQQTKL